MPGELPLYREARDAGPSHWHPHGHPGLWWDKFCDLWKEDRFSELVTRLVTGPGGGQAQEVHPGKLEWILTLLHRRRGDGWVDRDAGTGATLTVGDTRWLAEAHARRARLFEALGAHAFEAVLETPLTTGLGYEHPTENGFLFHRTLGVPFLPGSGLKGLARSWAESWEEDVDDADIHRIFGPPAGGTALAAGSVIVFDALPLEPVRLTVEVTTPHYRPWYEWGAERPPADWYDPVPVPFLALAPGARFRFAVAPRRPGDGADAARARAWLREALVKLGAGAKTAVGYGRFGDAPGGDEALADGDRADRARWRNRPVREPVGEDAGPPAGEGGAQGGNRAVQVLGPAQEFPIGTRVAYAGDEGTVVGYSRDGRRLVVAFEEGEREEVSPEDEELKKI